MRIEFHDGRHWPFTLIVPRATKEVLEGQNGPFRKHRHYGSTLFCAGNFKEWSSIEEMLSNFYVLEQIIRQVEDHLEADDPYGNWRFTVEFSRPIGWSDHIRLAELPEKCEIRLADIAPFTWAPRVVTRGVKAPKTNLITLQCCVLTSRKDSEPFEVVTLEHVAPGPDHGGMGDSRNPRDFRHTDWVFFHPMASGEKIGTAIEERWSCAPADWQEEWVDEEVGDGKEKDDGPEPIKSAGNKHGLFSKLSLGRMLHSG